MTNIRDMSIRQAFDVWETCVEMTERGIVESLKAGVDAHDPFLPALNDPFLIGLEIMIHHGHNLYQQDPRRVRRLMEQSGIDKEDVFEQWSDYLGVDTCHVCEGPIQHLLDFRGRTMLNEELCQDCEFWWRVEQDHKTGGMVLVVGGECFSPQPFNPNGGSGLGHAGQEFNWVFIRSEDQDRWGAGTIYMTNNLWHRGTVPDTFREVLPDNAVFLSHVGRPTRIYVTDEVLKQGAKR